jgi:GAF domain-containing protein
MRLLANYVAVSLNNAQLFAQVEKSLAEARELQAQYIQQAWQSTKQTTPTSAYERQDAPQLPEGIKQQLQQVAKIKDRPEVVSTDQVAGQLQTDQPFTAIVAPIKLQNQVVGTMEFHNTDTAQQREWTKEELDLVQAVADQVAQTAENLRLFDETHQRANQEQAIREITDKFRASTNLEELVKVATETLAEHLSATHVKLRLGIPAHQTETNGHHSS